MVSYANIDGLPPNIIFSISRSVYYERNDGSGSRVRICDNHIRRELDTVDIMQE